MEEVGGPGVMASSGNGRDLLNEMVLSARDGDNG